MGSSLVRWIVAGVLLAIFVALIVSDELDSPTPDGTVAAVDGAAQPGPATITDLAALPPPAAPPKSPEEDRERKPELEAACNPITNRLLERYGNEWLSELGDKLWADRTDADVIALCKEIGALPEDRQLARLTELTGITPPAGAQ